MIDPWRLLAGALALGTLVGCPYDASPDYPSGLHSVSGSVSGLGGASVTLAMNSRSPITLSGDGRFTFPDTLAAGASYSVAVQRADDRNCTVQRGEGRMGDEDVTNVSVVCTPR